MEGIPWDTGFEPVVGRAPWDALSKERLPRGVPAWHGTPTSTHRPWQAGPKPSSFCPWQGLAASVRLMKPSGCDTISSKLGREPLPVPVREGGRVPINKTILESQRKSLFCSRPHPPCFPMLYFYKRAGPRPTAFTQRSQLHIVAAMHVVLLLAAPPRGPPSRLALSSSSCSSSNELSAGGQRGAAHKQNSPRPTHAYPTHPWEGQGQQKHCKEQAWRPWASDTGLLCAQGPASTTTPAHLPIPTPATDISGSKVARWTHRHILGQGSKEQGLGAEGWG